MRVPSTTQTVVSPDESTRQDRPSTAREGRYCAARRNPLQKMHPSRPHREKIAEISARLNPILPAGKVFPIRIGIRVVPTIRRFYILRWFVHLNVPFVLGY